MPSSQALSWPENYAQGFESFKYFLDKARYLQVRRFWNRQGARRHAGQGTFNCWHTALFGAWDPQAATLQLKEWYLGTGHSTLRNGSVTSSVVESGFNRTRRADMPVEVPTAPRDILLAAQKYCANVFTEESKPAPQHQQHSEHATDSEAHQELLAGRLVQVGVLAHATSQPKCLRRVQEGAAANQWPS